MDLPHHFWFGSKEVLYWLQIYRLTRSEASEHGRQAVLAPE